MNGLRFVQNVLYKLKQRYGLAIDVYNVTATTAETGITTRTLAKVAVKRALVLESANNQKVAHDLAFSLAKVMGGLLDISDRRFIVDRKDLGAFIIVPATTYIVFKQRKFEVKEISEIENSSCFSVVARETKNEPFGQIFDFRITHVISLNQEVANES